MSNEMVPGRRYRVTKVWEGVADTADSIELADGWTTVSTRISPTGLVTVEESKPTYTEGRLYRDADGDVVLRAEHTDYGTDEDGPQPWVFISGSGGDPGERWSAATAVEPLVELELKEKQ